VKHRVSRIRDHSANRSLWPAFWRTPAAVRGSERARCQIREWSRPKGGGNERSQQWGRRDFGAGAVE